MNTFYLFRRSDCFSRFAFATGLIIISLFFAAGTTSAQTRSKPAAQSQTQAVARQISQPATPATIKLDAGTAIELETLTAPDVKYIRQGQMIELRVRHDVVINNHIVLPAGAAARAVVMQVRKGKPLRKNMIEVMPRLAQTADGQYVPLASFPHEFEEGGRYPMRSGATLYATVGATIDVEVQKTF